MDDIEELFKQLKAKAQVHCGFRDAGHTARSLSTLWRRFSIELKLHLTHDEFVAALLALSVTGDMRQRSIEALHAMYDLDGESAVCYPHLASVVAGLTPDAQSTFSLRRAAAALRAEIYRGSGPHGLLGLFDALTAAAETEPGLTAVTSPQAASVAAAIPAARVLSVRAATAVLQRAVPPGCAGDVATVLREAARPQGGQVVEAGQVVQMLRGALSRRRRAAIVQAWDALTGGASRAGRGTLEARYTGASEVGVEFADVWGQMAHRMGSSVSAAARDARATSLGAIGQGAPLTSAALLSTSGAPAAAGPASAVLFVSSSAAPAGRFAGDGPGFYGYEKGSPAAPLGSFAPFHGAVKETARHASMARGALGGALGSTLEGFGGPGLGATVTLRSGTAHGGDAATSVSREAYLAYYSCVGTLPVTDDDFDALLRASWTGVEPRWDEDADDAPEHKRVLAPLGTLRAGARGRELPGPVRAPASEASGTGLVFRNTLGRQLPEVGLEPTWGPRDLRPVTQRIPGAAFGGGAPCAVPVGTSYGAGVVRLQERADAAAAEWVATRHRPSESGFLQRRYFS